MWLTTSIGFYSIVEKVWDREEGLLTVRARVREDLDALRDRYLPSLGPTAEDPKSDYRFRAQAPREAVAEAVAALIRSIDYDNFKDAVAIRQGAARASVYHRAWDVFRKLQASR